MKHLPALILLSLSVLTACGPRYVIKEKKAIEEGVWKYADSLQFEAEIKDTSKVYDIALEVEHAPDYGFQNVYIRIHTQFPGGKRLSQPLSLELAGKAGNWLGKCGRKKCRLIVPIQQNAYFNEKGIHRFTVEQYMRMEALPGITGIGLHIVEVKSR